MPRIPPTLGGDRLRRRTIQPADRSIRPRGLPAEPPKPEKRSLMAKLRQAEQDLAGIRGSDPNAQWKLARLKSRAQFMATNDTSYWVCFCFESREQKDEFLKKANLLTSDEDHYFNGKELAAKLGIRLTTDHSPFHTLDVNRRWKKFALPKDGLSGTPNKTKR